MHAFEKRIATLEKFSAGHQMMMFIILVGMGQVGMETTHVHDNYENHWDRKPNETEEAFKERATSETPRTANQIAILFGTKAGAVTNPL